jgi:hypothetical protein
MSRRTLVDDDAAQYANTQRRLQRLEQGIPEDTRVVGAAGQPAFQNSWVNFDSGRVAGFYRDRGRVYLEGLIKTGASASVAFTLPDGYRPVATTHIVSMTSAGACDLWIYANGNIEPHDIGGSSVSTWCSLYGVSFRHV